MSDPITIINNSKYKKSIPLKQQQYISLCLQDYFNVIEEIKNSITSHGNDDVQLVKDIGQALQIIDCPDGVTDEMINLMNSHSINQISHITISEDKTIQTLCFTDGTKLALSNRQTTAGEFRGYILRSALEQKKLTNPKTTLFQFFADVFKDLEHHPKLMRFKMLSKENIKRALPNEIAESLVNDACNSVIPAKSFFTKSKLFFNNIFFKIKSLFINYKISVREETAKQNPVNSRGDIITEEEIQRATLMRLYAAGRCSISINDRKIQLLSQTEAGQRNLIGIEQNTEAERLNLCFKRVINTIKSY